MDSQKNYDSLNCNMSGSTALFGLLNDKLSLVLPIVVVLLVALLSRRAFSSDPLSHIPEVGRELGSDKKRRQAFLSNARGLYQDGYEKVGLMACPIRFKQHR
jgi:hypothetical protein